jgi:hypothetical protein
VRRWEYYISQKVINVSEAIECILSFLIIKLD